MALVNAALPGPPSATSFTYDPSGNTTASGSVNSWPFEYQGMEHEITDPANLYFLPSSNVYNPRMQADLSQVGPQGLSGPSGGPGGPGASPGSGSGGGFSPNFTPSVQESGEAAATGVGVFAGATLINLALAPLEVSIGPPGWIALGATALFEIFDDLFGGGSSSPPIPRQLMHRRHPLYGQILGISTGLTSTEESGGGPSRPTVGPCPPVPGPPGLLKRNIDLAKKNRWWNPLSALYLGRRMANGGKWDYRPANDDFGNFNYGATMAAAGYPDQFTLRFAGLYHRWCGTASGDESGSPLGGFPYGNRPHSEAEVAAGIEYFEMGCD